MKYCGMNVQSESEVESLLMSPCWNQSQNVIVGQDQYLLDSHKLLLGHDLDSLPGDDTDKDSILDNLLLNSSSLNASLAELKPLPPFTNYTGHLSINGISGHHYHAIAQRLPDDGNNNNFGQISYQQTGGNSSTASSHSDHNIVSSSTCLSDSVLNSDDVTTNLQDVKLFSESSLETKLYSAADSCVMSDNGGADSVSGTNGNTAVRIYADTKELSEYVDMNSIDDIAAIIGSAIADTTVPNRNVKEDGQDTRDSWMDLDAWIDGNCIQQDTKLIVSQPDSLDEFILPHSPASVGHSNASTLHSLLTHGYMPLLQNRLQNGPPVKGETPSSTSYCGNELTSTSSQQISSNSPPGSVVSTTDNIIINGRYVNPHPYQISMSMANGCLKPDGLCSPDLLNNFPHTTTVTPTVSKTKRSRSQKKQHQQQTSLASSSISFNSNSLNNNNNNNNNNINITNNNNNSNNNNNNNNNDLSGLIGKEKPVHRCNICNRGFLNKSNIKVHLRTHTGEKPFRCDVCSKAFRQKAHLLKHQQIHKRIGRD